MCRILIFIDSKWRDTPGAALLKHHLEKLIPEAHVLCASFNYWRPAIQNFYPHLVVLNHIQGRRNRMIADFVKRHGGLAVVQFNEGIIEFEQKAHIFSSQKGSEYVDLFLCWNEQTAELVDGVSVGCPRFDIYGEPLSQLIDGKDLFCDKYNLDKSKPFILFGDSWPSSKFTYMLQDFHRSNWDDLGNTKADKWRDADEFAKKQMIEQERFRFFVLAAKNSGDYQIAVTIHPMSDYLFWKNWGEKNGVTIIFPEYIFNSLNACDLYVAKQGSIAVAEGWLLDKIVIKLLGDYNTASSLDQRNADMWNLDDVGKLRSMLANALEINPIHNSVKWEYLEKWGIAPRNAGYTSAVEIAKLLEQLKPVVTHKPNLVALQKGIAEHDRQHTELTVDGYGNFAKAPLQRDILEWQSRYDSIIA